MEKKFEELVNDKCSWSYRSQIVCESNEINKLEQNSPYKQQRIIIETKISKNTPDEMQNNATLESSMTSENTGSLLHGYTNNSNKKTYQHLQNNTNKVQNISKNGKGKLLKKRCNVRNVTKTPIQHLQQNSDRILQNNYLKHTNTELSTPSSSSMEILQTRFSHDDNKQNYTLKELDNDSYSNISDKDTIQENDANKKTSPIIIQAIPYREMEAIPVETSNCSSEVLKICENDKFKDDAKQEILQHATKETELTCNDSLSMEANAPNSEISTIRDLSNASNNSEQRNLNSKNKVSCIQNFSKTIYPVPMTNICDDTVNQEAENISNEQIIQDFFSGSFDLSLYKPDDKELSQSRIEKRLLPNAASLNKKSTSRKKKNSSTSTKLNTELMKKLSNIASEYNSMQLENRDDILNRSDINSKALSKKSIQKYVESESNSPINNPKNNKVKKRGKKNIKSKQPLRKKQTESANAEKLYNLMKNFNFKINKLNFQRKSNSKNIERNTTDSDSSVILVDDISHDIINKEMNNLKTKNEARDESFITEKPPEKISSTQRKTRNSSLIASQKIKEIKKFEKSSDDDIIDCTPVATKLENAFLKKLDLNLHRNIKSSESPSLISVKNENSMKCLNDKQDVNVIHNVFESPNISNVNYSDTDIETSFAVDKSKMSKNVKNIRTNKSKEHLFKIRNELHSSKSDKVLKQKRNKNVSKRSPPFKNFNISNYDCLSSEDEEFLETFHAGSKMSKLKKKQNTDVYNVKNKNYANSLNQNLKKNTRSSTMKNPTTKRKTWDNLESELLSDLDNKNTTNVSKTVILKKEKITRKGEDNLFTVSNTSMMQSVSKLDRGDYNMKYRVQNLKRKYNCSNTNEEIYRYEENTFSNFQPKDVSMNLSILDRTIAAMDQCTSSFLTPQENTWENRYLENAQSDEITNNSSPNTEDVEDQSNLYHNYTAKNNQLDQDTNEAVIPFYKMSNNPWNKFMQKLSLEDKYEYEKNCKDNNMHKSEDYDDGLFLQETMHENSDVDLKKSQHQEKVRKCINKQRIHEEQTCSQLSYTDELAEGEFNKNNAEIQLLNEIRNSEIDYLMKEMNVTDIEKENDISGASNCSHHDNLKQDTSKETKICKIMTEDVKSKRQNGDKEQHIQESPNSSKRTKRKREDSLNGKKSFTLRLAEDGSLKFKKHSSKSSVSDISENDFKKSVPKDNSSVERDEYVKYLKNIFQKENSHEDISNVQGSSKVEKLNTAPVSDEKKLNANVNKASILIGEKDDDIFSVSSSDSDASVKEKTAGSGLFCDLFDD